MGRNLLKIFCPSFVKFYKFSIAKQQLIILSQMVQSKDWTTVTRMRFGLRTQLREDTSLSPGEAVFGTPIFLSNEFLQGDEFSVHSIVKNFFFINLDTLAFSLSRHNSSIELPAELPGELLRAPFFWLCHGGIVLPLHRPHEGLYTVLRHGLRSFTIRVGSRDKIVSISHPEACTEADTIPGSPQRRGRPPGKRTGGPSPSSGSRF
jgi:hypothetical protein